MSKIVKEDCKSISIYDFNKWGCLDHDYYSGSVVWTNSSTGEKNRISYAINKMSNVTHYIILNYKVRSWGEEDWTNVEHEYPIVSTKCNFGGKRYWFICSVYSSGIYCGRRVAKLYLGAGSNFFGCRHCYNLTYRSRIDGWSYSFPDIDEAYEKIGRFYYKGKPTKKYLAYLKKDNSVRKDMYKFMSRYDGKL